MKFLNLSDANVQLTRNDEYRKLHKIRRCSTVPLNIFENDNDLELLLNKRICRSDPCIFIRYLDTSSNFYPPRKTSKRLSSCGRRALYSGGKNDGIVNVLRRRALSRHFSNSFASSLDISSQGSANFPTSTNPQISLGTSDLIGAIRDYSISASSGYASRRSSLSGSPFPIQDVCTNWSDVSQSGCYHQATACSTPKSIIHSSFRSLFGDVESDLEIEDKSILGQLYSVRFPRLKCLMENRLKSLISHMDLDLDCHHTNSSLKSDGTARFMYSQILELAKDCLNRCGEFNESDDQRPTKLDTDYFNGLSNNLQRILNDSKDKLCCRSFDLIASCVDEFLLAVARTADVIECLDSNPNEFYSALTAVENQLNGVLSDSHDIHNYLISQLKTSISMNGQSIYTRLLDGYKSHHMLPEEKEASPLPQIHDFNIIKRISAGSYGSVYLVQHKDSCRHMALKRLSKNFICRKNFIQQVFTERDILTFVRNPFVVSLLCSFETDQDLCLVMEYVEGGDVRSLLDYLNGPLSIDMATLYFAETTLAVEYIHSYGVIHRDIKPSNLLITACGHIKLTDFGLSRIGLIDLTSCQFHDKQVIGTPQYIAPEVILRVGYGQPVDLWSMGILLYEMLVGCTPFTSDNVDDLFELIVNGELEFPEYLANSAAKELICMLLSRTPNQRPHYIRNHQFFLDIDWEQLLVRKAEFIPILDGPDDTSYFKHGANAESNTGTGVGHDNGDSSPFFYFSSYSPSFMSSVSSSRKFGNCDSDSGGSVCSSNQNLSGLSLDNSSMLNEKEMTEKQPKGRRFRGSLLRARTFFMKRVMSDEKKHFIGICINRDPILGYGFTFATFSDTEKRGRYTHCVLSISPEGPGRKAGLLKDHKIMQINERDITGLTHGNVVKLVQKSKHVLHIVLSCSLYKQ